MPNSPDIGIHASSSLLHSSGVQAQLSAINIYFPHLLTKHQPDRRSGFASNATDPNRNRPSIMVEVKANHPFSRGASAEFLNSDPVIEQSPRLVSTPATCEATENQVRGFRDPGSRGMFSPGANPTDRPLAGSGASRLP